MNESLTEAELKLARCGAEPPPRRLAGRLGLVGVVAACIGVVLIVGPDILRFSMGETPADEFRKSVGFCVVLLTAMFTTWEFARYQNLVRSLLFKLHRGAFCLGCGKALTGEACETCRDAAAVTVTDPRTTTLSRRGTTAERQSVNKPANETR